jgi:hypothetical protein
MFTPMIGHAKSNSIGLNNETKSIAKASPEQLSAPDAETDTRVF